MIEKLSSNELLIHKYNQSKYSVNVSRQSIGLILGRVRSGLLRPKTRLDRNQVWLPKTRLNPKNRVYNQVSFSSHGSSLGLDFFFFFFYFTIMVTMSNKIADKLAIQEYSQILFVIESSFVIEE